MGNRTTTLRRRYRDQLVALHQAATELADAIEAEEPDSPEGVRMRARAHITSRWQQDCAVAGYPRRAVGDVLVMFEREWRRVMGADSRVQDLGDGRVAASAYGRPDVGVYQAERAASVLSRYPDADAGTVETDAALVEDMESSGAWLCWLDTEKVVGEAVGGYHEMGSSDF